MVNDVFYFNNKGVMTIEIEHCLRDTYGCAATEEMHNDA